MSRNARHELCCFAATCLCAGTFMLILFAFDYAAGDPASPLRLPLIVAAATAFVLMVGFVATAIRMGATFHAGMTDDQRRRRLRRLDASPFRS